MTIEHLMVFLYRVLPKITDEMEKNWNKIKLQKNLVLACFVDNNPNLDSQWTPEWEKEIWV